MNPFSRVLIGVVALALISAAGIYHLGGKQIQYAAEIQIDGSAEDVMEHLLNPDLAAKWAVGFQDMETQTDNEGNSSEADLSVKLDGDNPDIVEQQVSAFANTDTAVSVNHSSPQFDAVSMWQVVPEEEGGVRLRQLMLANHKAPIDRMKALFNKSVVLDQLQEDLTRLKSLVETGEIPSTPAAELQTPDEPKQKSRNFENDDVPGKKSSTAKDKSA